MKDNPIIGQAARLETILPRIARRLFTLAVNHPASELPMAQLRTLSYLLSTSASPITDVAEELGVSVSAATQIADRLERAGLVEREHDPEDRRVKLLTLTAEGLALMVARRERRVERTRQALENLSPADRERVLGALELLLGASLSLPATEHGSLPLSLTGDLSYSPKEQDDVAK